MSEIDTPDVLIGGDNQPSRLSRIMRMRSVWLIAAVVIVLGGAVAAYVWEKRPHGVKPATAKELSAAVDRTVLDPNYAGAEVALNDKLAKTSDPKAKAQLYMQKSSLDLQQGRYQAVIDDQTEAVKLDPSLDGVLARTTADAYEKVGNKAKAIEYYKKSKQYYDSKPDSFSGKTYYEDYLKSKLAELQG